MKRLHLHGSQTLPSQPHSGRRCFSIRPIRPHSAQVGVRFEEPFFAERVEFGVMRVAEADARFFVPASSQAPPADCVMPGRLRRLMTDRAVVRFARNLECSVFPFDLSAPADSRPVSLARFGEALPEGQMSTILEMS